MVTVTNQHDNALMGRKEIEVHVPFQGPTLSSAAAQKELAKAMSVDEKLVSVKHVYTAFGKQEATVQAFVYKDEKTRTFFEVRKKNPKKKKEAAAPAEKK